MVFADTASVASGWDLSSFHVDEYGELNISKMTTFDRLTTGLLTGSSLKFDFLGDILSSKGLGRIGSPYDLSEEGLSIISAWEQTNLDLDIDMKDSAIIDRSDSGNAAGYRDSDYREHRSEGLH